jgi:uncharacterized membrane protein YdjX (TVP38/TMEM64 family)
MTDTPPYHAGSSLAAQQVPPDVPRSFWQRHWHKLLALLFWLALLGGYGWYTWRHDMALLDGLQSLLALLQTPAAGPLLYIAAFALRPLIVFPASLLTVLAGSVFGPLWAFVLTVLACLASASVSYLVGRVMGHGVLDDDQSALVLKMQRYTACLQRNSFETVLLMNLIFLPYDLINYLAGFLHVRFRPFLLASILGSVPGIITCVLLGASVTLQSEGDLMLSAINPWSLALSAVIFVLSIALSRFLKRREQRRQCAASE